MKSYLLIITMAAAVGTASASSLRSEIESMNGEVAKCLKLRDINMFKRLERGRMTSDFKYIENGQAMNYDKMIEAMAQSFAMFSKVDSVTTKILSVKDNGKVGTNMSSHHQSGTIIGSDKKPHKFVMDGRSMGNYVHKNGKWLMSSMVWINGNMSIDGKSINPTPSKSHK